MDTGGPTYLAMAVFRLASNSPNYLSEIERRHTLRWLLQNQDEYGGFRGRTNKDADACYCFWCGGAIQVFHSAMFSMDAFLRTPPPPPFEQLLGAAELVDNIALASYLGNCQFRFGGIAKAPGEHAGLDISRCMMGPCPEKSLPRSIPHISLSRCCRHVSAL